MLLYILGCVVFLLSLFLAHYCTDYPTMWDKYSDNEPHFSEPEVDFSSLAGNHRRSEHQRAVYEVLSTYNNYHEKLSAIDGAKTESTSRLVLFLVLLLGYAWFHADFFPLHADSAVINILVNVLACAVLYFLSLLLYHLFPLGFKPKDLSVAAIRDDFDHRLSGFFSGKSSLERSECESTLALCPLLNDSFDSFVLYLLSYRLAYMSSIYTSVLTRRALFKILDGICAILYLFLIPHHFA